MSVLFCGLSLFIVFLLLHLIVWRIRLPKRQLNTLLKIFFLVFIIGNTIFYIHSKIGVNVYGFIPKGFIEYLHISILFFSLVLAYIITYSAVEADSPSLVMVLILAKSAKQGLEKERLLRLFNDDLLVKPRVMDLVNSKLAYTNGDRYLLTRQGELFIRIFIFYRNLLKAGKGG